VEPGAPSLVSLEARLANRRTQEKTTAAAVEITNRSPLQIFRHYRRGF